ncbi:hypothetical protein [Roseovarius sp.]|jgi:hypothetical protein
MTILAGHIRAGRLVPLALACLGLTGACTREDEAVLRARLAEWFSIAETLAFQAERDCAAAMFRLSAADVKAQMPLVSGVRAMLQQLERQGRAALDMRGVSPDEGLVALVDIDRPRGMAMRRAALEGRVCMSAPMEDAFLRALQNRRGVLAWDAVSGTIIILDPDSGLLVVAMGAE